MPRLFAWLGLLAALGIAVRLGLDLVGSPSPFLLFAFQVAVFLAVGIGLYLGVSSKGKGPSDIANEPSPEAGRHLWTAFACGFLVSWGLAVWVLWGSLYTPAPPYHFLVAAAAVFVALQIAFQVGERRGGTLIILGEILMLGALLRLTFPLLNPQSLSSDSYFHWLGSSTLAAIGTVPSLLGHHFYFPSFHALNAILIQVGGLGFSGFAAYALINHLLMLLAVPGAYLVGREVLRPSHALFASLLIVFSPFFFLSISVVSVLLGAAVMVLAIHALLKRRTSHGWGWWVVLWLLTLFVFFSHPVNALVLGVVLVVFTGITRIQRPSSSAEAHASSPAATYVVAYVGYLVFMAVTAFALFIGSLTESGPEYYFARVVTADVPGAFVVQASLSTVGFTVLFAPAAFAALTWRRTGGDWGGRFLLAALAVLISVPAMAVLLGRGPYSLQAARTLLYISIFLVLVASRGFLMLLAQIRRSTLKAIAVLLIVFVVALFSTTSYLTGSGTRFLSDSIPVATFYAPDSTLATRSFLERIPSKTPLSLDPAMAPFLAPHGSGVAYPVTPYPIAHSNLVPFSTAFGDPNVGLALSETHLAHSGYAAPDTSGLDAVYGIRAYDNGQVRVYLPPYG